MQLSKHHGLGNDFLVALDPPRPLGPDDARRWCARRRGVGADGLLVGLTPPDADCDVVMVLWNADGSRAEMSGNGIRCLAQAEMRRRGLASGQLRVRTDAGLRVVDVLATDDPDVVEATVDMGPARITHLEPDRCEVDMGNPHLVLREGDVEAWGRLHPELNVEIITPDGPDRISMVVHERGVGVTEACGTGACAAAAAAYAWDLVGGEVRVEMPGGGVDIRLGERVVLRGPSAYIGALILDDPEVAA